MAVYPRSGGTEVPAQPSFPALEREVLEYWRERDTFLASVRQRPADREFVFYDGPPFANGLPHYGHIVTGFVKDLVPRYQTMRGKLVERRFGWDCHGLPAELHSETELKLSGRRDILEYGVARFNEHCRDVGDAFPARLGVLRQPLGALGRFRQRLPHHGPLLHGERHVGVQTALGQGAGLRGLPRRALFWAAQTPLSQFRDAARQLHPHAPGPGADGRVPAHQAGETDRAEAARLDDDAVDAAVQPGARGLARTPTTRCWRRAAST